MDPFVKRKSILARLGKVIKGSSPAPAQGVFEDRNLECRKCGSVSSLSELRAKYFVCPHCGTHIKIGAKTRIRYTADTVWFWVCP